MEDLIGPVNGLDLVGWYDDLILTFRKLILATLRICS